MEEWARPEILFQNSNFAVLNKPAGYLSVPARTSDKDPRPVLGLWLQQELKTQVYPVHRLDCEVRGLILFALNPKAQSAANSWFEHKLAQKTYWAQSLATPTPSADVDWSKGTQWECLLLRGKKRAYESPFGKKSLTQVRLLKQTVQHLEWELRPVTGRSHQLRFEMYRHGWPLLGDSLYGSQQAYKPHAIALEAVRLELPAAEAQKWNLAAEFSIPSCQS